MSSNWAKLQKHLHKKKKKTKQRHATTNTEHSHVPFVGTKRGRKKRKKRKRGDEIENTTTKSRNPLCRGVRKVEPESWTSISSLLMLKKGDDASTRRGSYIEKYVASPTVVRTEEPTVSKEWKRLLAVRKLRDAFEACYSRVGLGATLAPSIFESTLVEGVGTSTDPILPSEAWFVKTATNRLVRAGAAEKDARREADRIQVVLRSLLRSVDKADDENSTIVIRENRVRVEGKASLCAKVERSDPDLDAYDLWIEEGNTAIQPLSCLRINSRHYAKMRALYDAHRTKNCAATVGHTCSSTSTHTAHSNGSNAAATTTTTDSANDGEEFRKRLFLVLLRYNSLRGGGVHGGGMQAAAPEAVFDVLRRRFDAAFECFASPLNCRYGLYCSAFEDVDAPFGSIGSFWRFRPLSGSFQANPPFDVQIIRRVADHIDGILRVADQKRAALSFVVMVPTWRDSVGWTNMHKSPFLRSHLLLDRRGHGYCEGLQHRRPTRYRIAPHDTSVFFLQSTKGFRRWRPTEDALSELRRAFRSKHARKADIVAAKRRRGAERGEE
eukprot:g626.t1